MTGQEGTGEAVRARLQPPPRRRAAMALVEARLHPSSGRGLAAMRVCAMVAGLVGLAVAHLPDLTICPLRAATGVPCPFCGGTTAALQLVHGHIAQALSTSPLGILMLAAAPVAGVGPRPAWWRSAVLRSLLISAVLALSEAFQLHRFGLLT